jgi:hypothetical protein
MQINTKDLGWSAASNMPISSMRTARINLDNMDDRGKAHVIEWYTTTIEAHEVFMRTLEDPEDIKFAADSAKINLEEMRLFLEECIL